VVTPGAPPGVPWTNPGRAAVYIGGWARLLSPLATGLIPCQWITVNKQLNVGERPRPAVLSILKTFIPDRRRPFPVKLSSESRVEGGGGIIATGNYV